MLLLGQVLSKLATAMWNATVDEYTARAAARMQAEGQRLLELLDDLEELLATHRCVSRMPCQAAAGILWQAPLSALRLCCQAPPQA